MTRLTNLRSFLKILKKERELQVIDVPVDPCLELAEIQRRVVARQGPALLFTRIKGAQFPVAANLFGSRRRIDLAFGEDPIRFFQRIAEATQILARPALSTLWGFRDMFGKMLRLGTATRPHGPVYECIMDPPRMSSLPQIQSWPMDGGAFLTLPLVYSEHPVTGHSNLGMYRAQIYDDATAGMHFQIHRGLGFHCHEAEKLKQPLPVNVFLGGPPALILAAIAPLPENIPEMVLASLLMDRKVDVLRYAANPLPVVAEAEFALIGAVPPFLRREEGPFGDHYGYYAMKHPFPVFEVKKIFHRRDAIFPATVVGRPRQEDHYIGDYLQELFAPLYPLVMNGVRSVWAYDDAGMHPLAAAVVHERYHKEAFMTGLRILGEGQLSLTKCLLLTDTPLRLQDFKPLLTHILERADFAGDLFVFSPVSQDTLDYTSGRMNEGSKMLLMGLGEQRYHLASSLSADLRNPIFPRQKVYAPGALLVEGPPWKEQDAVPAQLLSEESVQSFRIVFLVDDIADCAQNDESFLWTVFTRFEPASDIYSKQSAVEKMHIRLSAPLVIDCRLKPWYPPLTVPAKETVALVDARWKEYFSGQWAVGSRQ